METFIKVFPYISQMVTGIAAAVLTFLAAEHATRQKREEARLKAIEEHKEQLGELKTQINTRIDALEEKHDKNMSDLYQMVTDIKATVQESNAVVELKLENLEEKQDKHNQLIDRMYNAEKQIGILQERMAHA